MYKKGNKIMSGLIVFIMLLANLSPIGQVIAADGLANQTAKTNNANVEADVYFQEGNGISHEAVKNIGEENTIVAKISVKEAGYLKDARVEFVDSNFKVLNQVDLSLVSSVNNNILTLNQINAGEDVEINIPFAFNNAEKINLSQFDKVSSVKFTAKYVDGRGKTSNIKKDIKLELKWTANTEVETQAEITKFVNYNIKDQKGLLLQALVKESIKENKLPIKTSKIEIEVPEINGVYPNEATVYSKENMEYTYDVENHKVVILTKNDANEQNEIVWNDEQRLYEVTFNYPETAITENEVNVVLKTKSNTQTYSYDDKIIDSNYSEEFTLKDKIGEVVDLSIASTEKLGKGFINANFDREEKLETVYNQKATLNISLAKLVDGITFEMNKDTFTQEDQILDGNSYYKNIKLSKNEFIKYFGEDGKIDIYSGETLVKTIDNSIEEENIVIELNSSDVRIITSKPAKEGQMTFEFEKAIKGDEIYSQEQIEKIDGIRQEAKAIVKDGENTIVDKTVDSIVKLENTVLEGELQLNNTNISTVVTNENVEIRAILKTNTQYNKLFKNPVVVITLPNYIENINVKNVQVLFDDELTVENYRLEGNQIIVELSGVQTNYSIGSVYGGTNIVITADLTTNNLTPNTSGDVTMDIISQEEQIQAKVGVNFIAPSGVVAINKISNYAEGQEVMALTEDENATLNVQAEARNATEEIQIINNYDNTIENIEILGRTLATDTTTTDTQRNLNNNINAPMLGAINTENQENTTVYYSSNGNATRDLGNEQNGWTTDVEDFSNVKSYLIVMDENQELDSGESVNFSYDMQIPENLRYSQTTTSLYTVYFDNVQEDQTINDQVTSRMVTLQTGIAPDLSINLSSNIEENATVYNGQYIKYIATIKNNGTIDAENTRLTVTAPSGETAEGIFTTKHVEYKEENFFTGYEEIEGAQRTIEVGKIKAGEEVKVEYEILVESVEDLTVEEHIDDNDNVYTQVISNNPIVLTSTASVIADRMQTEVVSNEYKLHLKEGQLQVIVERDASTDTILTKGNELTYTANVMNMTADEVSNVVVTIKIPDGLTIKEAGYEDLSFTDDPVTCTNHIDNSNNTVVFTIDKLDTARMVNCKVKTEVNNAFGIIESNVKVNANGKEYIGNVLKNEVSKLDFTITQSRLESAYVKEDENITFEYVVVNNSGVYTDDFTLENIVPDGMEIVSVQTIVGDDSIDVRAEEEDGKVIVSRTFKGNQTITFRITMKAKLLPEGQTQKQITNFAKIYGAGFETKESNKVNATIEYNQKAYRGEEPMPEDEENPSNPEGKKIISGIAFLDKNKDGERNDDEETISGMEVRLLNAETYELVNTTNTSSTGEYTFTGLDNGAYLVVFVYDVSKYDLTVYKNAGTSQSVNSDVIDVEMDISGETRKVGITDTLRLTDSNMRNIDIGLVESNKSDLKLDKYISSITVTYGDTVKTYEYNNSKLEKVEIPAKELSNATVIVNYKLVVTNEGAISNYVKKVVDYVPSGMKFNSELNRDWYESTNGDIYNSSLANIKLEPGQSKELTLTLTKKMTENNTGIINNNAELYEVYNEEGIKDYDSTPANKVNGEDDMSNADVVVGVKTGDAVIYTIIISTIICAILAVSAYHIRRHILKRM